MANGQTLAQLIKAKYPAYAKVPDIELEEKILAKYPQYKDLPRTKALVVTEPRAAKDTGRFLPPPGEFARRMGLQLISPVEPVARLGRRAATAIEGVERPASETSMGDTVRAMKEEFGERPVSTAFKTAAELSGVPSIGRFLMEAARTAAAAGEWGPAEILAATRGFTAGTVEEVSRLSPLEAIDRKSVV